MHRNYYYRNTQSTTSTTTPKNIINTTVTAKISRNESPVMDLDAILAISFASLITFAIILCFIYYRKFLRHRRAEFLPQQNENSGCFKLFQKYAINSKTFLHFLNP